MRHRYPYSRWTCSAGMIFRDCTIRGHYLPVFAAIAGGRNSPARAFTRARAGCVWWGAAAGQAKDS